MTIKATMVPNPGNGTPRVTQSIVSATRAMKRGNEETGPHQRNHDQRNLGVGEDGLYGQLQNSPRVGF